MKKKNSDRQDEFTLEDGFNAPPVFVTLTELSGMVPKEVKLYPVILKDGEETFPIAFFVTPNGADCVAKLLNLADKSNEEVREK